MDYCRSSQLTPLQRDLLEAFFEKEQRLFLTGGAALAGFYLGHRDTEDLDLFCSQEIDLQEVARVLEAAAATRGAKVQALRTYPGFRRLFAARGEETCVIDLVVDSAPAIDVQKAVFGKIRVDTLREIAANKLCTLLGRGEIKDLVDFQKLTAAGIELGQALTDAERKDAGMDPATLAWVLEQLTISPSSPLPGGADATQIDAYRKHLVQELRAIAYRRARRDQ